MFETGVTTFAGLCTQDFFLYMWPRLLLTRPLSTTLAGLCAQDLLILYNRRVFLLDRSLIALRPACIFTLPLIDHFTTQQSLYYKKARGGLQEV